MTPMEKQYNEIKKEAPDSILFFRLGDFYEMFGDDAKEASEILEIALTCRNKNAENPLPMCGIPAKAYERYLAKLTRAGKSVAIAEQVSDPTGKGIVERKITKIVSPGTTFSEQILEAKKQNFIAAFAEDPRCNSEKPQNAHLFCSLAFVELTTGESFVQSFSNANDAFREAEKQMVAELLLTPENFAQYSSHLSYFSGKLSRHFLPENSEKFLKQFFSLKTLKPFGIEKNRSAIVASSLLFSFLEDTQKTGISHISGISFKDTSDFISLDPETIRNLELFASNDGNKKNGLFHHLDNTKTALGGRALQQAFLAPFKKKEAIESRLSKTEDLIQNEKFMENLSHHLSEISDIERILSRISTGQAIPRDFVLLKNSLHSIQKISKLLESENPNQDEMLEREKLKNWNEVLKKIQKFF